MLTEEDLPCLFREADKEAATAQRLLFGLTALLLLCSLIAAIFGAISIERHGKDWAAVGSGVALAGGLVATSLLARWNPNRRWYDLRALAESLKSLTWLWSVGGGDFGIDARPEPEAEADLAGRFRELRTRLAAGTKSLRDHPADLTPGMNTLRASTLRERQEAYRQGRLEDQLQWYRQRASDHARYHRLWQGASFTFQAAGFVLAFLRFFEVVHVDLVGIATTAAVAAAAWLRARDHAGIAEAYRQTTLELAALKETANDPRNNKEWASWVLSAETAMSREHTSWEARRRRLLSS